jgi:DNA-binding NarL/FixJ family response regulator
MKKIKVLIVDDHLLVRTGIISLLKEAKEFTIVDEADNGKDAVEKSLWLRPDVTLMDISMPGMSGFEAIRKIRQYDPHLNILVLTMFDTEEYLVHALKCGATGIINKNAGKDKLIEAIKITAQGKRYAGGFSDFYVEELMKKYGSNKEVDFDAIVLTKREKQILKLIAAGNETNEIAEIIGIAFRTVQYHKFHLMQKLKLGSSTTLTHFAVEYEYHLLKK